MITRERSRKKSARRGTRCGEKVEEEEKVAVVVVEVALVAEPNSLLQPRYARKKEKERKEGKREREKQRKREREEAGTSDWLAGRGTILLHTYSCAGSRVYLSAVAVEWR